MGLQSPSEDLKAIREIKRKIKTQYQNIYQKEPKADPGIVSTPLTVSIIIDNEELLLVSRKRPESALWVNEFDNKTQIHNQVVNPEEIKLIQEVLEAITEKHTDPYSQPAELEKSFRYRLNITSNN